MPISSWTFRLEAREWGRRSTRRSAVGLACALVLMAAGAARAEDATPSPDITLEAALLHDPTCPIAGNPNGDVTIVAFIDYNCPYCKRSDGGLTALIARDPKVRVVYKDWPILTKSSVKAAKIAIAAAWQGKYSEVHQALMRMNARPATDEDISQAVLASGIDISRLNRDLDDRDDEIVALLKRNMAEADALGLQGTPVFIIGDTVVANALDAAGFKDAVTKARKQASRR
ncbi:MAG: DsbA family protein [Beijerinckiaceae bacterium]|nr:DsbA family protein [Beijerinckiaceae bacterium]